MPRPSGCLPLCLIVGVFREECNEPLGIILALYALDEAVEVAMIAHRVDFYVEEKFACANGQIYRLRKIRPRFLAQ